MLRSTRHLIGYHLRATDGVLGKLKDVLFDDASWRVRYLHVDTGRWLPARQVLVSPEAVVDLRWQDRTVGVRLTRKQVEDSPDLRTDLPVSRQHEQELAQYYRWAPYWMPGGGLLAGGGPSLPLVRPREEAPRGDPHLRAAREVVGYEVRARDQRIGHVDDLILETGDWSQRYLVADTRNWLPGRKVLLSTSWIARVDWVEGQVGVDLTAEEVRASPEYDPTEPVNREYEAVLHDFYGRPVSWK
jgi:hypothetical protein